MRYLATIALMMLIGGAAGQARSGAPQAGAPDYLGVWAGSWDGPSSGEFDLTLGRDTEGKLQGKIAVTAGSPPYTSDLKAIALDGADFTARYDYPLDEGGEVTLQITFDGRSGKGSWILRPPGQAGEAARGTLALSRK